MNPTASSVHDRRAHSAIRASIALSPAEIAGLIQFSASTRVDEDHVQATTIHIGCLPFGNADTRAVVHYPAMMYATEYPDEGAVPLGEPLDDRDVRRDFAAAVAIRMVLDERRRQPAEKGFDVSHDDDHRAGELAAAAACYAAPAAVRQLNEHGVPVQWPWDAAWWKPAPVDASVDARLNELKKAAAMTLSEMERLLRFQWDSKV